MNFYFKEFINRFFLIVFLLGGSIIFVLNFRIIFYLFSGFNAHKIADYNTIINYLNGWSKLSFRYYRIGPEAREHFVEVRHLVWALYAVTAIAMIPTIIYLKNLLKNKLIIILNDFIKLVNWVTVILSICVAMTFDLIFYYLHLLIFRNNYWIFDPKTDSIIKILPDTYFALCALLIVGIFLTTLNLLKVIGKNL
ncbi:MAG: TIGR01906 family membrane protein [Lactobacillales bacterium]|nr:TIGR01906 family membrane protein [Lactobacillales bacterium]